ncbi:MAG: hypothetical protein ABSD97_10870 [Acidimicrobiales bacterium]
MISIKRAAVLALLVLLATGSGAVVAVRLTGSSPVAFTASSLSAYEWVDTSWSKGASAYEPELVVLKELGVTDLFVDITRAVTYEQSHSAALVAYLTTFRRLVAEAAAKGLRVQALMGDLEWATSGPAGINEALAVMTELRGISAGEMAAGFQLDVEPWGLPDWASHEVAYALDYDQMVRQVAAFWKAGNFPGTLGFAVPFWWNGIGGSVPDINPGTGLEDPLTAVLTSLAPVPGSNLNVMAYSARPRAPGGTETMFKSDLATAKSAGSRVTLLLGQDLAPDPAAVSSTFAGSTWHSWTTNVATLRSAFASEPDFGGIAVEDTQALVLLHKG